MPSPIRMDPVTPQDYSGQSASAGNVTAQGIVDYATQQQFLNTRYVDHATIPSWGPGKGWDCSSYTAFVMKKFGVNLPAYSDSQFKMGTAVDKNNLKPGDLVFFHTNPNKTTGHVGIYIGNGKMVNAANPSAGTRIQSVTWDTYVGARRYVNVAGGAKDVPASPDIPGIDTTPQGDSQALDPGINGSPATTGQDSLSLEELALQSGFTDEFLASHPQVRAVFDMAVAEDWAHGGSVGQAKFTQALHETKWWKENSSYAREYLLAKMSGGAEWQDQVDQAQMEVQYAAMQIGADLSDAEAASLTKSYMMNGWKKKPGTLQKALTGQLEGFSVNHLDYAKGGPDSLMTQLRGVAEANGVTYNDGYYQNAARRILGGEATQEDYLAEIRSTAASRMPIFADRIKAGENAKDIASPYITRMAQTLEMDPKQISLDDPYIAQALGGMDDKGRPKSTPLWDFEKQLRMDPRWEKTAQGQQELTNAGMQMLKDFGFVK